MAPDLNDPNEVWGVLNPASARDAQNNLHLYSRLVAESNYSRIGDALVNFDAAGNPVGVTRVGVALSPEKNYEKNPHTGGGVEDPRITYIEPLHQFVMTYTAYSTMGPRVALAVSKDLKSWQRLGLVKYKHEKNPDVDLNIHDNKDAVFFPAPVRDPLGRPALCLIHRPAYSITHKNGVFEHKAPDGTIDPRPSVWFSYIPLTRVQRRGAKALLEVEQHTIVMTPQFWWESAKVGMGTPPIRTPYGWLALYHGVQEEPFESDGVQITRRYYRAGLVIFDLHDPRRIVYRTPEPIMTPDNQEEIEGIVGNVVFPTAIDPRPNNRIDFYYGMADTRIGAGTFSLPQKLNTTNGVVELPTTHDPFAVSRA